MCGGAIISDFIPTPVSSRRPIADYIWPHLNKGGGGGGKKGRKHEVVEIDDDFEADFEDFKDESEEDEEEEIDVKPFAFTAKAPFSGGNRRNSIEKMVLLPISFLFCGPYDVL